ncbi:Sodium/hydrogen exchanger 9 [Coelomomyces lativittatus]|nr:Sodium/hydrogen exchanger 9 [Coelomomyces lativittatus]KAJ1510462.1 Sodium/hydrogen exchanger 9 [Coelomomyces lativittatus]KAJ1511021.1 Sodium/hydrogen exchanger 9 [Coelomomyces lativittatus]
MSDAIHSLLAKSLVMLVLILIALNIAGWMKKREFKYFGETTMYISVGLATSILFRILYSIVQEDLLLADVQLSTNFFYMVLLPPIIFEGGYGAHRMMFFQNIGPILSLAFLGGIFSTVVIALVMFLCSSAMPHPISIVESLILGSLISSTDPVTILAMLPPETDRRLYMLIFGESALNDAVSIILYRFFSRLADPSLTLSFGQFCLSLLESLYVFLGSFAFGVLSGFLFAKLTKHQKLTHEAEIYEVTMMLVFAYSSYLLAEIFGLTGIISVFFCGITMAHYAKPNLTTTSLLVAKNVLRVFSTICESFIFMYLGMGLFAFPNAKYNVGMIFSCLFAIALGRTHVFLVSLAYNLIYRDRKIPFKQQIFVWLSGLRGAVSFALAVQLLDNTDIDPETRSIIFGTAIITIVVTVYGLNLITPFTIQFLGISKTSTKTASHDPHQDGSKEDIAVRGSQEYINVESKGLLSFLLNIDKKYLFPFFSTTQPGANQHDVTYAKVGEEISLNDLTGGEDTMIKAVKVGSEEIFNEHQDNVNITSPRSLPSVPKNQSSDEE